MPVVPSSVVNTKNISKHCPMSSQRQNHPPLENHCSRYQSSTWECAYSDSGKCKAWHFTCFACPGIHPLVALGCFHWGNTLTDSEMLRGSSAFLRIAWLSSMESLNFQWGIQLSSLSLLSSIICYILRLCDKVLLLVPTCHLCDSHSLPSPLTTVPLGCSSPQMVHAQRLCARA